MNQMLISCKESRIENNRSFYGCFNVGPFEAGQSLTVANALRRTLLSECTGVAIVSVMIENVHHEYSTLPGVRDSILDILLNLKELVFKKTKNKYSGSYGPSGLKAPASKRKKNLDSVYEGVGESFFRPVVGYLKVRGPGIIRAKDLRLPSVIQCADPEQYIATLGDDGFLNMQFIIMEGKNYVIGKATRESALLLKRESLVNRLKDLMQLPVSDATPAGSSRLTKQRAQEDFQNTDSNFCNNATQLYLDAIFNPVTKVNYIIEPNENKLVENSNKKYALIEDISGLIHGTDHLKHAFPFLPVAQSEREGTTKLLHTRMSGQASPADTVTKTKEFIEDVDNLSAMECTNLWNSLHPLKKENTMHNVVLEIWTNGSLHPRDALAMAFANLANVFLNLQQTEIMNPVFNDWAAYKKTLSSLASSVEATPLLIDSGRPQAKPSSQAVAPNSSLGSLDISTLNISLRTYTKLKTLGIGNVGDLMSNWDDVSSKFEKKTVKEIITSLKEINLM